MSEEVHAEQMVPAQAPDRGAIKWQGTGRHPVLRDSIDARALLGADRAGPLPIVSTRDHQRARIGAQTNDGERTESVPKQDDIRLRAGSVNGVLQRVLELARPNMETKVKSLIAQLRGQ